MFSFVLSQDSTIHWPAGLWSTERIPTFNIALESIPGNKQPQIKKTILRIALLDLVLCDLKMLSLTIIQPIITILDGFYYFSNQIYLQIKYKPLSSSKKVWNVIFYNLLCNGERISTVCWIESQAVFSIG